MNSNFSNTTNEEIKKFYQSISKRIRYLREKNGITQLELALEIGIKSVAFYSNCENNRYNKHFNLEHLYKISKVFNINICDFFESK